MANICQLSNGKVKCDIANGIFSATNRNEAVIQLHRRILKMFCEVKTKPSQNGSNSVNFFMLNVYKMLIQRQRSSLLAA